MKFGIKATKITSNTGVLGLKSDAYNGRVKVVVLVDAVENGVGN